MLWLLYWNPQLKIMVVSASKERADAFSQFCLRLIYDIPDLRHLAPKPGQRRSLIAFDVAGAKPDQSPSVKSVGITGQLTGSRADVIIADDVEVPKNSQTQQQREKLAELVKEFDAVIKPLPGSRIIYLGTPQTEMSLYNELAKRGYEVRIWPARMPSPEQIERYMGRLAPRVLTLTTAIGKTLEPARFSDADLASREASYGRSGFALQFMLDTSLADGNRYPLRCSDLIVMDVDSEVAPVKVVYGSSEDQRLAIECVGLMGDRWYGPMYASRDMAPYEGSVMFVDPSGRGNDRTTFAVVKMLRGCLYLTRVGSFPGGYDELTLTSLAHAAREQKVQLIIVEPNFGDGMYVQLLKPYISRIHPCNVEDAPRAMKQKEVRIIDVLEPVLNQHRLVVSKRIVEADIHLEVEHQLFHQLTRLTKDRGALAHDDAIDAVAGAVAYWASKLDVDQTNAEQQHQQEALEAELARWMEGALGGLYVPRQPNWTDEV